jgi:hypothetical protein
MTHTLDIGTDLDDLLASIGDLTIDSDATTETAVEGPALISTRMFPAAWYQ